MILNFNLRRFLNFNSRSLWTSVSECHGFLSYIQPQTRLRIVDNSPWSSIAPGQLSSTSGSKDKSAKNVSPGSRKTASSDLSSGKTVSNSGSDGNTAVVNVQSFMAIGLQTQMTKPAKCIWVYNKRNKGQIGDKVLVAVAGQKKKGWIVGSRLPSKGGWPRFESNNIVLVDDDGNPLGTRILVPIPHKLKSLSGDISKILSIATKFV